MIITAEIYSKIVLFCNSVYGLVFKMFSKSLMKNYQMDKIKLNDSQIDRSKNNAPQAQKEIHLKVREIIESRVLPALKNKECKVLDAASGSGYMSTWLHSRGFDVTALDVNTNKWKVNEIPVHFADLNKDILLESNLFDMVVSIETIEHLENPFHFIRELHRVTKPNGLLIITTPNVHAIRSRLKFLFCGLPTLFEYIDDDKMGQHITPVSIAQFIYAFQRIQCKIVDVFTTGPKGSLLNKVLSIIDFILFIGTSFIKKNRKQFPEHYLNVLSLRQLKEINSDVSLIVVARK